jgi:hypothetical protein
MNIHFTGRFGLIRSLASMMPIAKGDEVIDHLTSESPIAPQILVNYTMTLAKSPNWYRQVRLPPPPPCVRQWLNCVQGSSAGLAAVHAELEEGRCCHPAVSTPVPSARLTSLTAQVHRPSVRAAGLPHPAPRLGGALRPGAGQSPPPNFTLHQCRPADRCGPGLGAGPLPGG